MSIKLPPVPNPPPPSVPRVDSDGKPTVAVVTYETDLRTFLKAVKAALEAI